MTQASQEVVVVTAIELFDRASALTRTCRRADLERRLTLVRQRVQNTGVRVLVVGEPKRGKSSLVNALVGAPVCPVGEDVVTRVPTVVRGGREPRGTLVLGSATAVTEPGSTERVDQPIDDLAARLTADPAGDPRRQLLQAEVELPRTLLETGRQLVDPAGVGGVGAPRSLATLDLLPTADAVLVVTDASQEFTGPEMAFLRQAAALSPNLAVVVTKTDSTPHWRQIVELDRRHLRAQGVDAPVFAVSATLAAAAVRRSDRELYEESGLRELTAYLVDEVGARASELARRSFAHDLTSVAEHLTLALRSEL